MPLPAVAAGAGLPVRLLSFPAAHAGFGHIGQSRPSGPEKGLDWPYSSATGSNGSNGALVSLKVEISNPGNQPLLYGPLIVRSSAPSYRPHPPAELALPIPAGPGEDFSAAALFNARGAPGPSLFGQPPIPPHSSITGWISVVVAPNAASLVGMPRSALELSPVDGNPNYVGIIRLWKNAAPEVVPSSGV